MTELPIELGFGLAACAWAAVALLLLSRRSVLSSQSPSLWLISAAALESVWAAHALPSVAVQTPEWADVGLQALRAALFTAFMLALLSSLRNARVLRLASALTVTLALAQIASAKFQLGATVQQTFALMAAVYCVLCIEQVYRNAVPEQHWLLKYACLAPFLMFTFEALLRADALLYGRADPSLQEAQAYVDALVAPLMALGSLRLLPKHMRLRFSRDAVFHTATLLISGLFLLAMAAIGYGLRAFGSSWGGVLQWVLIFSAGTVFLVLLGSGQVRAKTRVWISKHFFSHRYDYRKEWLRLTELLSGADEVNESHSSMAARGLRALVGMVGAAGGQLWLQDDTGVWRSGAQLSVKAGPDFDAKDGLVHFLGSQGWIIDIEAWRDGRAPQGCPAIPAWLKSDADAWILMAIHVQASPVALLQLQRPLAPIPVDWEVRDLLKAAGQQVAGLLRTEQALESLVQARQFDSFNRMSAFVVHDLKNLVAQLGLMLRNAEKHRNNPHFQADMLETAAHVQDRMQTMLLQLGAGTRPIEVAQPVDLDASLARVVHQRSWPEPAPELRLDDPPGLDNGSSSGIPHPPRVLAHADRLERVIGHLIQNAIEATDSGSPVLVRRQINEGRAVIEVIDKGRGMDRDFISRDLFKPFRSTKPQGMGIGAFESREYILELGGSLDVASQPGQGSTFSIRLPMWTEPQ
ncbi:MAG: XrtA/PEP-CTERM system histidine kinase PrsK [Burkholderiaceae bacterium]